MHIGQTALGNDVEVPVEDFTTAGTAILAMRGAGKSWLSGVLAEQLSKERIPFVIVDPEGEYWTLRVRFSNVIIAGGEHADIPLEGEIAEILGRSVVEDHLQLVLDLSDMRRNEQREFLNRFLSELFAKGTELKIPIWICFEEADIWVPQSGNPICKTAVLDICQRGRKRGIGFALVSQRPSIVDKTALSQAEFRFFKRFQQPHDLRAVKDYLGSYSDMADTLPSLSVQEALLYAPTISESPTRIQVADRICPHGGATPDQVAKITPSTTTLDLREKLSKYIATRKRELDEMQKRDAIIEELKGKVSQLEEALEKAKLATDVAEILAESGAEISKVHSESEDSAHLQKRGRPEDGALIPSDQTDSLLIEGKSIVRLGRIGINSKTGVVIGSNLAETLLNRIEPEERVVFLTLQGMARPASASEIAEQVSFGTRKTRSLCKSLTGKGLLRKAGRNRRGKLYATKQV